ncbi:MAG: hypothetical protein Q4C60_01230 [Eubacteriales bacterium]|nr:hypothetical protein [Eubacteriales bacterium]
MKYTAGSQKRKKKAVLILAVILALALAACGYPADGGVKEDTETGLSAEAAAEAAAGSASQDGDGVEDAAAVPAAAAQEGTGTGSAASVPSQGSTDTEGSSSASSQGGADTESTAKALSQNGMETNMTAAQDSAEEATASSATQSGAGTEYSSAAGTVAVPEDVSGNSIAFRMEEVPEGSDEVVYREGYPQTVADAVAQLQELAAYWEQGDMAAVEELIRSERFRYMSQLLQEAKGFYYYGEKGVDTLPDGKGIAVYAGDQYYYGTWRAGRRDGEGTWIRIFDEDGSYSRENEGLLYHSYTGEWADGYPNGEGQEHMDYDQEYMTRRVTTNVIGTYRDGYYDGKEYLTTLDKNGNTQEWTGTAQRGVWQVLGSGSTKSGIREVAVCEDRAVSGSYIWMKEEDNSGQGIEELSR